MLTLRLPIGRRSQTLGKLTQRVLTTTEKSNVSGNNTKIWDTHSNRCPSIIEPKGLPQDQRYTWEDPPSTAKSSNINGSQRLRNFLKSFKAIPPFKRGNSKSKILQSSTGVPLVITQKKSENPFSRSLLRQPDTRSVHGSMQGKLPTEPITTEEVLDISREAIDRSRTDSAFYDLPKSIKKAGLRSSIPGKPPTFSLDTPPKLPIQTHIAPPGLLSKALSGNPKDIETFEHVMKELYAPKQKDIYPNLQAFGYNKFFVSGLSAKSR